MFVFHRDGKHILWTSTKDHPEFPKGNFSDPKEYPKGAELYMSDLDGGNCVQLTNNETYDAVVSVSPNGFGPSDHASFYSENIPVFTLIPGLIRIIKYPMM